MNAYAFGMLVFLAAAITTSGPESPFSWTSAPEANKDQQFTPEQRVLGLPTQPSSISLINFHDERPYGDAANERAWLVRYDALKVPALEGDGTAQVTLFLVFRQSSGGLLAAFTEAAPIWAEQGWTSADIAKRAASCWDLFPPEYATLRSSVVDVLQAIWKRDVLSPMQAGQITIRPRQFLRRATIHDENGQPIPQAKANGWLVEVLGTLNGFSSHGAPMKTHVVMFRDGDLAFSGGLRL